MCRLIEEIVRSGLVTAWRFASCPTSRSPVFVKATTEGVVRLPSALAMTVGVCPSITATTEFVVPRSMPTTLAMLNCSRFPSRVDHPSRDCSHSGLAAYRGSRTVSNAAAQCGVPNMIRHQGGFVPLTVTAFLAQWFRLETRDGIKKGSPGSYPLGEPLRTVAG